MTVSIKYCLLLESGKCYYEWRTEEELDREEIKESLTDFLG